MHLPDGALSDPRVTFAALGLSAAAVGIAARRVRTHLSDERLPLIGVLGAFVFAAQMVNLPVPGTPASMHISGAGLLTVVLGPSAAILALAAVLLLQALIFADGGVLAWGANTLNLAVVGSLTCYVVMRTLDPKRRGGNWTLGIAALGAGLGLLAGAALLAVELTLCGLDPALVWAGVLGGHVLFATGEGLITALSLAGLRTLAPALLVTPETTPS